jgi:hypothetical protein
MFLSIIKCNVGSVNSCNHLQIPYLSNMKGWQEVGCDFILSQFIPLNQSDSYMQQLSN